jgi:hypothetical protein
MEAIDYAPLPPGLDVERINPAIVASKIKLAQTQLAKARALQGWLAEMNAAGLRDEDGSVRPMHGDADKIYMLNRLLDAGHAVSLAVDEVEKLESAATLLAAERARCYGVTLVAADEPS